VEAANCSHGAHAFGRGPPSGPLICDPIRALSSNSSSSSARVGGRSGKPRNLGLRPVRPAASTDHQIAHSPPKRHGRRNLSYRQCCDDQVNPIGGAVRAEPHKDLTHKHRRLPASPLLEQFSLSAWRGGSLHSLSFVSQVESVDLPFSISLERSRSGSCVFSTEAGSPV
jgi:hypothetical protein